MRILLVDDDETLVDLLTKTLVAQNYALDVAIDGEQGWVYGSTYTYDLIILDWSLPKLDGITLCRRFRTEGYNTPIILLTSRDGSQNKIRGLDAGADDYICKPFDLEELTARIRALLRRLNCDFLALLSWGDLHLDSGNCQVTYKDKILSLAAKEYRLLELFLRHSQEVLSIEDIIESLWSSMEYPAEATIRSHIRRLREKLKLAGLPEDIITTVRGQGYCLKPLAGSNNFESVSSNVPNTESITTQEQGGKRSQHVAALALIWEKHRPKREQQLATLEQFITSLEAGNPQVSDRLSAIVIAHSLAGNLGQFGLDRGSQLAKELEQLLQHDLSQSPTQLWELSTKLQALRSELDARQNIISQLSQKVVDKSPLLLIIHDDENLCQQLIQEAANQGIRTKVIATADSARDWLAKQRTNYEQLPDAVLLKISFTQDEVGTDSKQESLALIAEFRLLEPSIPVIVIGDRDLWRDRLQVARHGGKLFLSDSMSPSQTIAICQQVTQYSSLGKKIMIVDDDIELLQVLPTLLEPWGFNFTTLDDPRQFWDVLQAVNPDLLILDVEMPYLSGIELCKVLQTHTYWCKLPVLFLSVHQDFAISTEAFASGASDFISKPVIPKQLANRILNRLSLLNLN